MSKDFTKLPVQLVILPSSSYVLEDTTKDILIVGNKTIEESSSELVSITLTNDDGTSSTFATEYPDINYTPREDDKYFSGTLDELKELNPNAFNIIILKDRGEDVDTVATFAKFYVEQASRKKVVLEVSKEDVTVLDVERAVVNNFNLVLFNTINVGTSVKVVAQMARNIGALKVTTANFDKDKDAILETEADQDIIFAGLTTYYRDQAGNIRLNLKNDIAIYQIHTLLNKIVARVYKAWSDIISNLGVFVYNDYNLLGFATQIDIINEQLKIEVNQDINVGGSNYGYIDFTEYLDVTGEEQEPLSLVDGESFLDIYGLSLEKKDQLRNKYIDSKTLTINANITIGNRILMVIINASIQNT